MDNLNKNRKTKTSLSRRQNQIIQILVQMDAKPVTVAAIAEKLKVSSRTILRELPLIEEWMSENDFRFIRKTGVGLQIAESPENLELIRELLVVDDTTKVLGKEERRRRLLGELLFSSEPVKAFSYTSAYGISEGTLFSDLDYLDQWLEKHQIRLIRRQGVGIFIEGEEKVLRQAVISAVFELYDINQVMGLLPIGSEMESVDVPEEQDLVFPPLLVFLTGETRHLAAKVLRRFRNNLDVRFKDSALVGLYIRIALTIYRVSCGQLIQEESPDWEQLKSLKEYQEVKEIQKLAEEGWHVEINEYEVLSMTEYLSSARIWTDASFFTNPLQSVNIRQLVSSFIKIVENLTGLQFHEDRILIDDLVSHFSAVMDRSKKDMFLSKAQVAPIRNSYPEIFSAVETAVQILGATMENNAVSEADAGFIAMHFAAAAERIQSEAEKVVVVVVCPLGMGASRMLASSLKRTIHNIEIRRTVSAFEIHPEELQREGVDLIVSTTELNTDFPHVCIGKVLQTQDKAKLQNKIDEINRSRVTRKTKRRSSSSSATLADIRRTSLITTEIVELIENFRILQLMGIPDFQALQEQAAYLFARSDHEKAEFLESFRRREEIGTTYIKEMEISLLHCKSSAAKHSRFGYIRLEQPLRTEEGIITGGVVMIAPEELPPDCLEPISRLTALLIEEPGFLQALQRGDTSAGVAFAEQALVKYYVDSIK